MGRIASKRLTVSWRKLTPCAYAYTAGQSLLLRAVTAQAGFATGGSSKPASASAIAAGGRTARLRGASTKAERRNDDEAIDDFHDSIPVCAHSACSWPECSRAYRRLRRKRILLHPAVRPPGFRVFSPPPANAGNAAKAVLSLIVSSYSADAVTDCTTSDNNEAGLPPLLINRFNENAIAAALNGVSSWKITP